MEVRLVGCALKRSRWWSRRLSISIVAAALIGHDADRRWLTWGQTQSCGRRCFEVVGPHSLRMIDEFIPSVMLKRSKMRRRRQAAATKLKMSSAISSITTTPMEQHWLHASMKSIQCSSLPNHWIDQPQQAEANLFHNATHTRWHRHWEWTTMVIILCTRNSPYYVMVVYYYFFMTKGSFIIKTTTKHRLSSILP